MKIGILTFHNAYNFGAVLQGYAMQHYLVSEGHEVEFINYTNPQVALSYHQFRREFFSLRHPRSSFYTFLKSIYRTKLYRRFKKNVENILKISSAKTTTHHYNFNDYDCIIIGSDQLWSKKITKDFDYFYCAKFNYGNIKKVIGYAISINQQSFTDDGSAEVQKFLPNFFALSVRESSSVRLLSKISDKTIYKTIDPTFLINKKEWLNNVMPVAEKDYILVFPILNASEVISQSQIIARRLKKELVIVEPIASVSQYTKYKKLTHPFEFISYIANADMIITSSFHGTAFSLIFEKDFYVLGDDSTNVRMRSFLNELNLLNRIVKSADSIDVEDHIDYLKVDKILSEKILYSKTFLNQALHNSLLQ